MNKRLRRFDFLRKNKIAICCKHLFMNGGKYVFSQIMDLVSSTSFQTLVTRHKGEYKERDFSCRKQFLCMAFGSLPIGKV